MYNKHVNEMLKEFQIDSLNDLMSAFREIAQKIVLIGFARTKIFNQIAFYGGTSLRIFHGLERFSEDLDFTVIEGKLNEDMFNDAMNMALKELGVYGIEAQATQKDNTYNTLMMRKYIKFKVRDIIADYFPGQYNCHPDANVTIKIEVDFDESKKQGAKFENKIIDYPDFASVKVFDYPSLFAGKLGALLFRNWRTRVKGRDFYDYLFYVSNHVSPNMEYLSYKIGETFNMDALKAALKERFETVDLEQAKQDVLSFVRSDRFMNAWSKELFLSTIDNIK